MIGVISPERQMEMTIQKVALVGSEKQLLKYKTKDWRVQIKVGSQYLVSKLIILKYLPWLRTAANNSIRARFSARL